MRYDLPFGFPGRLIAGALVRRELGSILAFRAKALRERFGSP